MINIHCRCHKLALACVDTVSELKYMKFIENTLCQLRQWLENSPTRLAAFLKVQVDLKSANNVTDKATEGIARRLKNRCSSRWLSFDKSVLAVKQECDSSLQTLDMFQDSDAAACGFLQKLKQVKFLGTISTSLQRYCSSFQHCAKPSKQASSISLQYCHLQYCYCCCTHQIAT